VRARDFEHLQIELQRFACRYQFWQGLLPEGWVPENADPRNSWQSFLEQLELFVLETVDQRVRASDVSLGLTKVVDEPLLHGIRACAAHHDRNLAGCRLCSARRDIVRRDDDVDAAVDKLLRQGGKPIHMALRAHDEQVEVAPLLVTELMEALSPAIQIRVRNRDMRPEHPYGGRSCRRLSECGTGNTDGCQPKPNQELSSAHLRAPTGA